MSDKGKSTKPSHEQAMAGYEIACKFHVFENKAFQLADEMFAAFAAAAPDSISVNDMIALAIENKVWPSTFDPVGSSAAFKERLTKVFQEIHDRMAT